VGEQIDEHPFVSLVFLLSVLAAAFFIGYFYSEPEGLAQGRKLEEPPISKYEKHLLALDREALDTAYKEHIKLVFSVWMKDPSDPSAPIRAGTGARNARAGFEKSMEAIEKREHAATDQPR
jgi:hypothetical protein